MNKKLIQQQIKDIKNKYQSSTDSNKNINILKEIVALRNGKIKNGHTYIKNNLKITFIDALGNEFKMTPSDIKAGHWSSYECGLTNDPDYHMKELKKIVESKCGKIKEGEFYTNSSTKMIFIDSLGNEFKISPGAVKQGQWSSYEAKNSIDKIYHMKQLEDIAKSKGGKVKDGQIYINSRTKMTFIDSLGNEFKLPPNNIKQGQWSPYESGRVYNDKKYHIQKLQEIAKSRGGKIKDGEVYINSNIPITFIDQLGNEFKMSPNMVKRGSWSKFEKNYSENICRQIIEQIYKHKFSSTWAVIKRKNGNNLQLDGYCKELNIAFEYQGEQHFFGWRGDKDKQKISLANIQQLDKEKIDICKEKNIFLIHINYYKNMRNIHDLILQTIADIKNAYIKENCELPSFLLNIQPEAISVDLTKISHIVQMMNELEVIVQQKGGRIKDGEQYIHSKTKMTFIDKLGYEFSMSPNMVKKGGWSPYESGHVFNDPEYHFNQLEKIAHSKGGKIKQGQQYINTNAEMIFIDKLGNEFKRKPGDVKAGLWSPYETKNPTDKEYHFKILQEIAQSKGGRIKEGQQYIDAFTEIIFIDKLGHEFKSSPTRLKNGKWSPYETKNPMDKEYHFKILQEIAQSKGGCIKEGQEYINNSTKMTFVDYKGIEFKMTPNNVKRGKWPKKHTFNID